MNFKYMAEMILNRPAYLSFLDFIKDVSENRFSLSVPVDIFKVMGESLIDAEEVDKTSRAHQKGFNVSMDVLPFIVSGIEVSEGSKGGFAKLLFAKNDEHVKTLKELYGKFGFGLNKHLTVEKILEHFINGFTYDITLVEDASV